MAIDTSKALRSQIMYSVFVRSYSPEGTFEGVRRDLPRIRDLGTDIIWFMPIHPIGEAARKGSLGSPYAIRDYRAVNPEFGTLEDFRALVDDIHALGMKCIIDVVYNHTSPDSVLVHDHPEWFYRGEDGAMGNHLGAWSDVVDLDYSHKELWGYQIETLKYWAGIVDGFRCDVAPLVPLEFWLQARREVSEVRPGCLWLAESGEPGFIRAGRRAGLPILTDGELYRAFDLCYDYDIYGVYRAYLRGDLPLERYAEALNAQEFVYPENYCKLRFLENHDQRRAAAQIPDPRSLRNWTALLYFLKGTTLLYNGQERSCAHCPSLFDRDPIDWTGEDLSPMLRRLAQFKRDGLLTDSLFHAQALPRDILLATHEKGADKLLGVFSLRGESSLVKVSVPDGVYDELAGGGSVEVQKGYLSCTGAPVILRAKG